jgi:uncharacterized protein (DUF1697 family)
VNRYVAFLRGMNLGGRRIKNDELRREFEALGFADIACFRASGNVIFEAGGTDEAKLARRIESGLGEALGYEVPVFLRDAAELREIAAKEPFGPAAIAASKGKLQVAFLQDAAKAPARRQALALAGDDDRLALEGRELYWLPSGGISETELDLKSLEATVGPWTMRTKGTVGQIASKYLD